MAETKSVNYKRETATKCLMQLMNRVETMNKAEDEYMRVVNLYIFGSYLRRTSMVHDLDVAIEFERTPYFKKSVLEFARKNNHEKNMTEEEIIDKYRIKFQLHLADMSGDVLHSYFDCLFWFDNHYYKKIKNRSRVLSLHSVSEMKELNLNDNEYVCLVSNGEIQKDVLYQLLNT